MIGRLLCALGLHSYEWRDERVGGDIGATYVDTYFRCRRGRCSLARRWILANRERRPW